MKYWVVVLIQSNTECILTITVVNYHILILYSHQARVNHRHLETISFISIEHFNQTDSSKIPPNYAFKVIWALDKFQIQRVRIIYLLKICHLVLIFRDWSYYRVCKLWVYIEMCNHITSTTSVYPVHFNEFFFPPQIWKNSWH